MLDGATNIRKLLLDSKLKGKEEYVENAIDQIHQQMAQTCGRWFPELINLRFVETIGTNTTNIPTTQAFLRTVNGIIFIAVIFSTFFYLILNDFYSRFFMQKQKDEFCWECHHAKNITWTCATCNRSFHDSADSSRTKNSSDGVMTLWRCKECIAIEEDLQLTRAKYDLKKMLWSFFPICFSSTKCIYFYFIIKWLCPFYYRKIDVVHLNKMLKYVLNILQADLRVRKFTFFLLGHMSFLCLAILVCLFVSFGTISKASIVGTVVTWISRRLQAKWPKMRINAVNHLLVT